MTDNRYTAVFDFAGRQLAALVQQKVPVHVCQQTVEIMGKVEMLTNLGFGLEFGRDAFIRFALEGATVISL